LDDRCFLSLGIASNHNFLFTSEALLVFFGGIFLVYGGGLSHTLISFCGKKSGVLFLMLKCGIPESIQSPRQGIYLQAGGK